MIIDMTQPKDKRILQAAEVVFSRHGYEKATLDEIIALADVGKGTVYKYFGNKEQLFYKLVADKNAPFVERLKGVVSGEKSFVQKLHDYFKEMVAFYVENSTLWQIICFDMTGCSDGCRVHEAGGEFTVVSRYDSAELDDELKERVLRYHNLLYAEYDILYQLIVQARDEGCLRQNIIPEICAKFEFFGVAMSIFDPSDNAPKDMPADKAADIIVNHFMHGNGAEK